MILFDLWQYSVWHGAIFLNGNDEIIYSNDFVVLIFHSKIEFKT